MGVWKVWLQPAICQRNFSRSNDCFFIPWRGDSWLCCILRRRYTYLRLPASECEKVRFAADGTIMSPYDFCHLGCSFGHPAHPARLQPAICQRNFSRSNDCFFIPWRGDSWLCCILRRRYTYLRLPASECEKVRFAADGTIIYIYIYMYISGFFSQLCFQECLVQFFNE